MLIRDRLPAYISWKRDGPRPTRSGGPITGRDTPRRVPRAKGPRCSAGPVHRGGGAAAIGEARRNEAKVTINWRLTIADARTKPKRAYPSIKLDGAPLHFDKKTTQFIKIIDKYFNIIFNYISDFKFDRFPVVIGPSGWPGDLGRLPRPQLPSPDRGVIPPHP